MINNNYYDREKAQQDKQSATERITQTSQATYGELNTPGMCSVLFCKSYQSQKAIAQAR